MRHQWKLALATVLLVAATLAEPAAAQDDNTRVINEQTRIETRENGVEIEIRSSRSFPVRALPPVLRIGDLDFTLSRNSDDGRLDTLIFLVPTEEFADIDPENGPMQVLYALSIESQVTRSGRPEAVPEPGGLVWDFGTLRKELLDDPRLWDVPGEK